MILLATHRFDEAFAAASRVVELEPFVASGYRNLAVIENARGTKGGLAALRKAIEIDPEDADAYAALAVWTLDGLGPDVGDPMAVPVELCHIDRWSHRDAQQLGRFEEGERLFKKAIALKPESALIHANFSHFYLVWGKIEGAKKMLAKAAELDPGSSGGVYNNLAFHLAMWGIQLDEALESAQKAIQLGPGVGAFFDTLAFVHFRRGEFEQAEQAFRRCIELGQPEEAVDWFHLGRVYERQNRLDAAITAYEKSLSLKPDYSDASNALQRLRR